MTQVLRISTPLPESSAPAFSPFDTSNEIIASVGDPRVVRPLRMLLVSRSEPFGPGGRHESVSPVAQ